MAFHRLLQLSFDVGKGVKAGSIAHCERLMLKGFPVGGLVVMAKEIVVGRGNLGYYVFHKALISPQTEKAEDRLIQLGEATTELGVPSGLFAQTRKTGENNLHNF